MAQKATSVTIKIPFVVEADKSVLAGAVEAAKRAIVDAVKIPKRVKVDGAKVFIG